MISQFDKDSEKAFNKLEQLYRQSSVKIRTEAPQMLRLLFDMYEAVQGQAVAFERILDTKVPNRYYKFVFTVLLNQNSLNGKYPQITYLFCFSFSFGITKARSVEV